MPTRSLQINGVALAVCHRCLGIYLGLFLAVPILLQVYRWDTWIQQHTGVLLATSIVPLGLDWSGDFFGLWVNTPYSRMITGGILGIVAGYFVARGIITICIDRSGNPNFSPGQARGGSFFPIHTEKR